MLGVVASDMFRVKGQIRGEVLALSLLISR